MEKAPTNHSTQSTPPGIPPQPVASAIRVAIVGLLLGSSVQLFTIFGGYIPQSKVESLITVIVTLVLMFWLYGRLYDGRNWARYVVLSLSVLGWLMFLSPEFRAQMQYLPLLGKVTAAANTIVNIFLLWAIFISPGKLWFRKSSAAHAA
jgi:hypothetical protein